MYGMLLESIMYFGRLEYGEIVWEKIREDAGCKTSDFNTHQIYSDSLFVQMANSCSNVLGKGDVNDYLRFFGRCFVRYCSHYHYDKMLRVTGRHFCQFLREMDNLHSQMRFGFPKMKSPSMVVTKYDNNGAVMQYRSSRTGLSHYLMGQLLQIANDFFDMPLNVEILSEERDAGTQCTTFRLEFDNGGFVEEMSQKRRGFNRDPLPTATFELGTLFLQFPFGMVLGPEGRVRYAGEKILMLLGTDFIGSLFSQHFIIQKPHTHLSWETIILFQNVVWEVESKNLPFNATNANNLDAFKEKPSRRGSSQAPWSTDRSSLNSSRGLLLKGQMYVVKELNIALFLCMPLLNNLVEMREMGLFLNDLSMHDLSREMVLAGWQHCSRLQIMYNRAEEYSTKLEDSHRKNEEAKAKGDELLYSMLPRKVADILRQGNDPYEICQTFEEVTVLFAEVSLAEECAGMGAMDYLKIINELYNVLDNTLEKYFVFKVETVGGVYMVVGGAPEHRVDHCSQVASLALQMIEEVARSTSGSHCLRIGMHVGPVAAGVVGLKLPRYCLFGDTVNTASRMQTNGQVGRVHISEKCANELEKFDFITTFRGKMQIKGKGEMNTYWLEGKAEPKSKFSWK
ncbi:soluble guanylate cyclase 89Da-like [Palaemon carinicauda]|uniref:soluble guanylate cyclase 89Da-like n=1 Tax=Palaemon carinicauda TaxID=392227 RepID=UPI0035B5C6A6